MRRGILVIVCGLMILAGACAAEEDAEPSSSAEAPPTFVEVDLDDTFTFDDELVEQGPCPEVVPEGEGIVCATLFAPADHADPAGAELELAVALLPPFGAERSPPAIYLEGGPGFGAIPQVEAWVDGNWAELRDGRWVVLYDQRGTGYSAPDLRCPELVKYDDELDGIVACSDRLSGEGDDLAWFTSAASAADVDLLATALGLEQVDLMGSSYGSRLALTVVRDFPDRVRAVAIDGVYPPEADGAGLAGASDTVLLALDGFVALCSQDPDCVEVAGDPAGLLMGALEALEAEADDWVDGTTLLDGLPYLLFEPDLVDLLVAVADGDLDAIDELAERSALAVFGPSQRFDEPPEAAGVDAVYAAITCAEEVPFADTHDAPAGLAGWPPLVAELVERSVGADDGCDFWGVPPADPVENEPVRAEVPTLVIVGELDAVTPPAWAERAAASLVDARLVVVPGRGHDAADDVCVMSIIVAFLDDPAAELDTSCLADLEPFRYEVAR